MQSDWEPSCSLEALRLRAKMLSQIRSFFDEKGVLEVETPLLGNACGTDPSLAFFTSWFFFQPYERQLFLQTSPEFAMKRLLSAGSGSIYQICKAFRNGESGKLHNPEFTILEWYRVGYSLSMLMDEMAELIKRILKPDLFLDGEQRLSYCEAFNLYTGIDPLHFSLKNFTECARNHHLPEAREICGEDHSTWLDFLFSHLVQPNLGIKRICMVYDYPACQASLARLTPENPRVAERVELFLGGVEIGNGFYELNDAEEQNRRFNAEIEIRKRNGAPEVVKDRRFLDSLEAGLPECSGVALGLDRMLLVNAGKKELKEILAFPMDRA